MTITSLPPAPPADVVATNGHTAPIRPRTFRLPDLALMLAVALSAFCLIWVVFYELTPLSGAFGFLVCWYATFLTLYWSVSRRLASREIATDRVITIVMTTGASIVVGLVVFIVAYVAYKAIPTIHWGSLFTHDTRDFTLSQRDPLSRIGVAHAIVGTLEEVGVAAVLGVPFAIATAVFLNEVKGKGTRLVRSVVTAMSGIPSVVAGVFIYSVFIIDHILGYSGFAAALALFVIILPSVTRTTEEVLRVVPGGLREAALALGAPEWRTVWSVVLPTARSGIVTAVLLGIARIVGETAPLLFTAFGSSVMNANVLTGPQEALPFVIWQNVHQAQAVLIDLAYQAAFVLLAIVLVLFVSARLLGRTRGGERRRLGARLRRLLSPGTKVASAGAGERSRNGGTP